MNDTSTPPERATGFQRAADAMLMALPLVQRLLPLLDGHVGSAVSNLLNSRPKATPPPPPVNLTSIEDGLAGIEAQHNDLRAQVLEQNELLKQGFKRIEEQLELVSEATDSNVLAQQEVMDELKAVGKRLEALRFAGQKTRLFALVALGLLTVCIAINVVLLLHFRRL
jgi:hypothetical protein